MFLTNDDLKAMLRDQWERDVQALLVQRGMGHDAAWQRAHALGYENRGTMGEINMKETPEEAVRQEYEYS